MKHLSSLALIVGGLLLLLGVAGIFVRFFFPPNDGALAIAGAVIFSGGLIAQAITNKN